jgi:Ran GTPase-activating protein (RanGAP) involved in mRNA processing and transport
LASLHVGNNNIPEKEMREIMAVAMHMDNMKILCGVPFKDKTLTELNISGTNKNNWRGSSLGTEGALVVAEYLGGNRALKKLDISNCGLSAEGGKVLAAGLKGNQGLTELNLAGNNFSMSGIVALADAISDMRALSSLNLASSDCLGDVVLPEGWKQTGTAEWTHTDGSKTMADPSKPDGIIALANAIHNMGALLCDNGKHYHGWSLNPAYEDDPEKEYKYVTTDPDVEDQNEDPGELDVCQHCGNAKGQHQAKGAITSLDVNNNNLGKEGTKLLAEALKGNQIMTELDLSSNSMTSGGMSGLVALADAIRNMEALSKLNLATNVINEDGAKLLAPAISNMMALNSLNLSQNRLLNKESGHALALALLANSVLAELDISKNFDFDNSSSRDGSGFAESFAYCLTKNKSLKILNISDNNIHFSDDLFTSLCAVSKVLVGGNNYSGIANPCLKVLCERKVLEVESIGKVGLHSQKLTGQWLAIC